GGTVLDWHGGLVAGLAECGARRGVEHDWHGFANEYRRRSLKRMLGAVEPGYNIDEVHRDVLDELLGEIVIDAFSAEDRRTVAQRNHDGGLPQFRPRCGARARLSDRVRASSRRVGTKWTARPGAKPGHRPRCRRVRRTRRAPRRLIWRPEIADARRREM